MLIEQENSAFDRSLREVIVDKAYLIGLHARVAELEAALGRVLGIVDAEPPEALAALGFGRWLDAIGNIAQDALGKNSEPT